MTLTIYPASHPARPLMSQANHSLTSDHLFQASCPKEHKKSTRILRTSFNDLPTNGQDDVANTTSIILSSHNGFVRAAWDAYAHHYRLRIRPEDVWFAILTQFSFYVNAHSEKLRSHFVAHEGKKQLNVTAEGSIEQVDIGQMALQMTEQIHENVVDPGLRDWIMPDFTTTDKDRDSVTAAVIMMGTMQAYFAYRFCCVTCGIPSVTMLGEREDWVKLRQRVDKLASFGRQTEAWAALLIPVLDMFVRCWDKPQSKEVKTFWSRIADYESGSGFSVLTGWITSFCFFDADGKAKSYSEDGEISVKSFAETVFPKIDPDEGGIPDGFVSVPVEVIQVDGTGLLEHRVATRMVAGSVGMQATCSGGFLDESHSHDGGNRAFGMVDGKRVPIKVEPEVGDRTGRDTLQPLTGWWMYELNKDAEDEAKQVEAPKGVRGYDFESFLES